jgi:hypothetical protein
MFVKLVTQGLLGNPGSVVYESERAGNAVQALLDGFELEMAERMRSAIDDGAYEFDCVMCFVWHVDEVDAAEAYSKIVRKDKVFEVSGSIDVGPVREAEAPSAASAIIRFALQSASGALARRKLGDDIRAVFDEYLRARA